MKTAMREKFPSALSTVFGRRLVWRVGRALYRNARADVPNGIDENGERDAIGRSLDASAQFPGRLVYFDIGANVGDWTAALMAEAATRGLTDHVEVHAFEPVTSTFAALEGRLATLPSRGSVRSVKQALSDSEGVARIHVTAERAGTNSLNKDPTSASAQTEEVLTTTLTAYCDAHRIHEIHFAKCDAEGHDMAVLRGAKELLRQERIRVLQFEYNHRWVYARQYLRDVFDLVEGLPYTVGKVLPGRVELFASWHPELERFFEGNYALVHQSARAWLNARPVTIDHSNTFA